ncbi:MAG: hypothetical protein ACRDY7_08165 [Acidimicrobiia bacterium]
MGKPLGEKKGCFLHRFFHRRHWPTAPDGLSIAIPTSWKVPGAQAAPTIPNRRLAEGACGPRQRP